MSFLFASRYMQPHFPSQGRHDARLCICLYIQTFFDSFKFHPHHDISRIVFETTSLPSAISSQTWRTSLLVLRHDSDIQELGMGFASSGIEVTISGRARFMRAGTRRTGHRPNTCTVWSLGRRADIRPFAIVFSRGLCGDGEKSRHHPVIPEATGLLFVRRTFRQGEGGAHT
jgi:hypothetical protein